MRRALFLTLLMLAQASGQARSQPEPAKPSGQAFDTYNLFWPGETDAATNVVYACTYVSVVVLAGDRLVALVMID